MQNMLKKKHQWMLNFHFSYYGWSKQSNSSLNYTFCPDFSLLCLLIGHWTAGAVIPILLHAKIECICVIRFCFCPANSWNPFHGKPRIRIDVVAGCYFWKLKWKKCIKIILPAWSFFFLSSNWYELNSIPRLKKGRKEIWNFTEFLPL